jgi:hypothetical protein
MTAHARTGTVGPEALRDLAEKSAAQAKENLETMSAAAAEAADLLKHGYATTVTFSETFGCGLMYPACECGRFDRLP